MRQEDEAGLFDPGLQPERTALAWRRTSLAIAAAAVVAARIMPELLGTWALIPAGIGVLAAMTLLVLAHRRHTALLHALARSAADRAPRPGAALQLCAALFVGFGGLATLIAVSYNAFASTR
jgi:uncharacterized membrane protein YidH (DUF202 family)